jgi:hypothetical protein
MMGLTHLMSVVLAKITAERLDNIEENDENCELLTTQ